MKLSRGIQIVEWKNKHTRGTQQRFRVRIKRADFQADRLFETADEAEKFLAASKTRDGQLGLTEREERQKAVQEAFQETLENRPLREYMNRYADEYIGSKKLDHPTKERSRKTNRDRLDVCMRTVLDWKSPQLMQKAGFFAMNPALAKHLKDPSLAATDKQFGDFLVAEVDSSVATRFIRARLNQGCAKSTVRREVGALQTFFNKLRFIDPAAFRKLPGGENPFEACDKSLLRGHNRTTHKRIAVGDEAELWKSLAAMRNPAMLQIVALSLATAMRRGECLFLKWSQIHGSYILLDADETKSERDRRVILNDDAKRILATVKPVKGRDRLFNYTADGFKSNWRRALDKAGIDELKFHTLRHEAISRVIERLSAPSAVVLSTITGMLSTRHLHDAYLAPHEDAVRAEQGVISSVPDLMKSVGHTTQQMLLHYSHKKLDES